MKRIYTYYFLIKSNTYIFFFNAGFFNFFYNKLLNLLINLFYSINIKNIEKGFFELFGPTGLYIYFKNLSKKSRYFTPVFINISIMSIYLFLIFIVIYGYIQIFFIPFFIYILFFFYQAYN
jgi:hypothetical protein